MTTRTMHTLTGLCLLFGLVDLSAQKTPTIVVPGPTIVAFFATVMDAESSKSAGANEALSAFRFTLAKSGSR